MTTHWFVGISLVLWLLFVCDAKETYKKFEYDKVYKFQPQCGLFGDPTTSTFPCDAPPDLEPSELPIDTFSFKGYLFVNKGTSNSKVVIFGNGFPTSQPVSVLIVPLPTAIYFQRLQLPSNDPLFPHPIWEYVMPTPAIACVPTTVGFKNARDGRNGANTVQVDKDTRFGYFEINLDYDPTAENQIPLPNSQSFITQDMFPLEPIGDVSKGEIVYEGLNQIKYKNSDKLLKIATDFLRFFNDDGTMQTILDKDGNPKSEIVRAPLPAYMFVIISQIDGLTHGNSPGVQFNPAVSGDSSLGAHYELGLALTDKFIDVTSTFQARDIKKYVGDYAYNKRYTAVSDNLDAAISENPTIDVHQSKNDTTHDYSRYTFYGELFLIMMNASALLWCLFSNKYQPHLRNKSI